MKKTIFVNNTAATSGGALSILKQFITNVAQVDIENTYYIFCNMNFDQYATKNVIIVNLNQKKSMKERLKWDYFGLKKWSKTNKVAPDVIISLQNTAVYGFKKVPQIIYLHQPIPFYFEHKWSIRKNKQLWFYKNIYKWLIVHGSKNKTVIVQTSWFAKRAKRVLKQTKEIIVLKPNGAEIDISNYKRPVESETIRVFYPTSPVFYKNYHILIDAIREMKSDKIELVLTVEENQLENIDLKNIPQNITFLGPLSYSETIKQLSQSDALLFPSYIETFGLPLLEAAAFGKPILTVNLEYAKEILSGYSNVQYLNPNDVSAWVQAMSNIKKGSVVDPFVYQGEWEKFIEIINM